METVSQETNATNQNGTAPEQGAKATFTQEEVNQIVKDRLSRESAKFSDYEELKAKAAKFDEQEEAQKTELQKANEKAAALESELNSLKAENELNAIRSKVASETGLPLNLITATTEELCREQAKAILEYAKPGSYPKVKDNGETKVTGKQTTREQFKEWAKENL